MSTPKLSKAEALRKTIAHTREEAIAMLSDDDKKVYEKILCGDRVAIKQLSRQPLGSALYEAGNYVLADYLDIVYAIERLDNVQPSSGVVSVPSSMPSIHPSGGRGIPVFPNGVSIPGLTPSPSSSSSHSAPVAATDLNEVTELWDAWIQRYGSLQGVYIEDLTKLVVSHGSKELLCEMLDRGMLTPNSTFEVGYRDPKKTYLTKDAMDYKKVLVVDSLIGSKSTAILSVLSEHALGREMFENASYEAQYQALRFSFDTRNVGLLNGFLSTNIDISSFRDPYSMDPLLVDFLYRTETEEDVSMLRAICDKGIDMDVRDRLQSTPLVVAARIGNLAAFNFLCEFDLYDVYAKNSLGEDLLNITQAAPQKRREDQEHYDESVERAIERFSEKHKEWEAQAAVAEAAGKKPPPEPKEPQFNSRPIDYPVELVAVVQDLWMQGDPSKSKQAVGLAKLHKPDDFAMDFDPAF